MSINLFCYTVFDKSRAKRTIDRIIEENKGYFQGAFHIYDPTSLSEIEAEIANENGVRASSLFLVRLNDNDRAEELGDVARIIKNNFGDDKSLILFENETKI